MQRYSIGELAGLTGQSVKTVRFYADRGIVPAAGRNTAGHRVFDQDAVARLQLVRVLRELGVDLRTVRKVLDRELTIAELVTAQGDALDVQIRALRFRRALLTAITKRGATSEEMSRMHRLATASEDERHQLVSEFLSGIFRDLEFDRAFAGIQQSLRPVLPDDPDAAQVDAWIELVELTQDPGFRARMRGMAESFAANRPAGLPRPDAVAVVRDALPPAGVAPTSPEAGPILTAVVEAYAQVVDEPDTPEFRRRMLASLESANDPRRDEYLRLLSTINGWPPPDPTEPALTWCIGALRAGPMAG